MLKELNRKELNEYNGGNVTGKVSSIFTLNFSKFVKMLKEL